ncbi:MAG: hypothetical protein AWU59_2540 [Methanolobus sp. T82-4]|nr:MAG: hypothetical protein AWU59_2540 [Methanolobus sp. T82-4]
MIPGNLTAKEEILELFDARLVQLRNSRKKVLEQCEDEFKDEIKTKFSAKIEEIDHIKSIVLDSEFNDNPRDMQKIGKKIYINV